MDSVKKSLLEKIAGREVLAPFEAIHLQHLNHKYVREQMPDMETWPNLYIAAENVPEIIDEYTLKRILSFSTRYESQQYDAYKWAAGYMTNMDRNIGDIGYKGLALMNELRYIRSDWAINFIVGKRDGLEISGSLFEHLGYSQVNQKQMKYSEVLSSFGYNFRLFVMAIDNILTLNHFLNGLIETKDLRCLEYLNMWLAKDESVPEEENDSLFNVARLAWEQLFNIAVDKNHPDFVEYMRIKLTSFEIDLPINFKDTSLEYLKGAVGKVVMQNKLETRELKQV
ncbi:MAG: hypothetical protein Q8P29_01155 [Candidatus Levybacteria bacterium]|nr:hypothetical protein [Candidatus Levybacteria bacterium]